jgi:hypothetical protein
MFDADSENFDLKPARAKDRPARRAPKEISGQVPTVWLASTSPDEPIHNTSTKRKVSRIVGIILPLLGIAALIAIGVGIAVFIMGVYK